MTKRQQKRLRRNAAKGNRLESIRTLVLQRKILRIQEEATAAVVSALEKYQDAQVRLIRQVKGLFVEMTLRPVVKRMVASVVKGVTA